MVMVISPTEKILGNKKVCHHGKMSLTDRQNCQNCKNLVMLYRLIKTLRMNNCYSGKNGERRGCCRGQTFDLDGPLECCQDIGLVPFGTCLGETTVHESFVESVSRGP